MTRETLPYGCWPSPVSAEMVAGKSLRFGSLQADGGAVYWSESRPDEGGRGVIMRAVPGGIEELLPAPWSARSKVHEYGGGEFLVAGYRVFFVEADTQDVFERGAEMPPRRLTHEDGMRFADMTLDAERDRLIAVAERHLPGSHMPENLLAAIDLSEDKAQTVTVLAEGRDFYASPRIDPVDSQLAFLAWDLPHMPWEAAALYVVPFNDDGSLGEPERIAGGEGSAVFQPEWRPDGSLCFVWDVSGWGRLYAMNGDCPEPVTPDGLELFRPQWVFGMQSYVFVDGVNALAACIEDGVTNVKIINTRWADSESIDCPLRSVDALGPLGNDYAFIGARDDAPASVVSIARDGYVSILSSGGATSLDAADISVGEVIRFDGEAGEVFALWYPPASARFEGPQDERPPTIVMVHGGPTGMADRGLKLKIQYWTSRGFAVCDLDYSGSAGYGRAYRERLNGNWGILDLADVRCLADHLVECGKSDPERLVISGGSAGGYTVLMALARLDIFAAGGCTYGVSDLSQLQRITHKFEAGYLYGLTGTTQETCEPVFAERSPLTHADAISCPVIFFQGLDDKVVPPQQSRSMVESLRKRGVPVAYMEFGGEGHGFRKAETIVKVLENEYAFYARVLGLPVDGLANIEIENFE